MNLRELNIIYNKAPNFMQLTDAQIIGLYMIFENDALLSITLVGIIIGLAFILYGQFKYNKGIF